MSTTKSEQPGASTKPPGKRQKRSLQARTGSSQFTTFRRRVISNIGVREWHPKVMQHFIEAPQLIPEALNRGFNTLVLREPQRALDILEKVVWGFTPRFDTAKDLNFEDERKLLIWLFRQSEGLVEDVVLHSPFDPDQDGYNDPLARSAVFFTSWLRLSEMTPLELIMEGLGTPLSLSTASSSENTVWHFFLTTELYGKGRRLHWHDAMEGIKGIEPPMPHGVQKIALPPKPNPSAADVVLVPPKPV